MMRFFRFILFLSALLTAHYSSAQSFDEFKKRMNAEFGKFETKANEQYDDFYREINARYAEFMKLAWTEFETQPAVPSPKTDPPVQPVYDPEQAPEAHVKVPSPRHFKFIKRIIRQVFPFLPIPETKVVEEEPVVEVEIPKEDIPEKAVEVLPEQTFDVEFFGATCSLRANKDAIRTEMADYNEQAVSSYWTQLADGRVNSLINDCLSVRTQLQLCDWGYWQFIKSVAGNVYGDEHENESIVLQAFIMTQSGYKVRLGRNSTGLIILISSDSTIYNTSYFIINGTKFYAIGKNEKSAYICNFEFPGENLFSLQMSTLPALPIDSIAGRDLHAVKLGDKRINLNHNRNILNFLDSYPQCSIDNFAHASLDSISKEALYPVLKEVIKDKTEEEAANILINFVQTAFQYKVDDEQFGYERTLFANETLYYPYSDCEDRSLLFATLVRELLNLEVVLLDYPEHIATAVCFNQDIDGDYMMIENKKYIVCDPTYIGADIGNTMPMFINVAADIIKIE